MSAVLARAIKNQWVIDKEATDAFLGDVCGLLGRHLIVEPTIAEDQLQNTDLKVLSLRSMTIAVRLRKLSYIERYPDDVTFRSDRPSGAETELAKMSAGWGDVFFYGFHGSQVIEAYTVIDLAGLRLQMKTGDPCRLSWHRDIPNADGSSKFDALALASLNPRHIVARRRRDSHQWFREWPVGKAWDK